MSRPSSARKRNQRPSGYRPCACRDCFETAIGEAGALCWACQEAGCEGDGECQAPGAYGIEHLDDLREEPEIGSSPAPSVRPR